MLDKIVTHANSLEQKPTDYYPYFNHQEKLIFVVYRFQNGNKKRFVPYTYNPEWDEFEKGLNLELPLRPLYNMRGFKGQSNCLIVEGEKCAEAAQEAFPGWWVTSWHGGSSSISKSDWAILNRFDNVYFWPDADEPGLAAFHTLMEIFKGTVYLVETQEFSKGYDVADYIADKRGNPLEFVLSNSEVKQALELVTYNNRLSACLINYIEILCKHAEWSKKIYFEEMQATIMLAAGNPIKVEGHWCDEYSIRVREWLMRNYEWCGKINARDVEDAIALAASKNKVNLLRKHLDHLSWDGIDRLDYSFIESINPVYTSTVLKYWMLGAIKRAYEPGCKFDEAIMIEGAQGIGKSTFLRLLGGEWYADVNLSLGDKDIFNLIRGLWIVEMGEMSALNRADVNEAKQFFSVQHDVFRPPYARHSVKTPRRCVFAGTCNNSDYLRDSTGNRRYLPIEVLGFNLEKMRAEIPKIWAQLVNVYRNSEHFTLEVIAQELDTMRANKLVFDPWYDKIRDFCSLRETIDANDVMDSLHITNDRRNRGTSVRINEALRLLGYTQRTERQAGSYKRLWQRSA